MYIVPIVQKENMYFFKSRLEHISANIRRTDTMVCLGDDGHGTGKTPFDCEFGVASSICKFGVDPFNLEWIMIEPGYYFIFFTFDNFFLHLVY